MRKTLIKTLNLENGKLYGEINGRRICMAECEPMVEIYEHNTTVPFIGSVSYGIKKHHITIIICDNMQQTNDIDEKILSSVSRYGISADIWRKDGIFESITFDNIIPTEIDLDGAWKFEADVDARLLRKLMQL